MARRPSPEKINHPLRLLREALSEMGEKYPITQAELSQITGIPLNTIKALEQNQRPLSDDVRVKIALATGAVWDARKRRWVCGLQLDGLSPLSTQGSLNVPDKPFTREFFLKFREQHSRRPEDADAQEMLLMMRMMALLQKVSDQDWHRVFFEIQRLVDRCAEECGVEALKNLGMLSLLIQRYELLIELLEPVAKKVDALQEKKPRAR